jgi:glycosyltransferase involved in cell wall biosynthesis
MTASTFPGRLGIQQRVLPAYRALFFETLARRCVGGLNVFAGKPMKNEGIEPAKQLTAAHLVPAENLNFLNPGSPWFMCWQRGFIHWLEDYQPDVLIVEANPRYPKTRQAIAWMRKRGRQVIGWGLGAPPIGGLLSGWRRKQRSSFINSLGAIIAYSQLGARQYRQLDMPAEKVYVASNAAAPAPSGPPARRAGRLDGQPVILFVGRLQARKRVDLLLRACSALPANLQPRLVVVGEGPAFGEFRQLAEKLYPAAEFVGPRHGADLEAYFDQADLFVLPGTGGLAIQEAMAHGLPVVVAHGDGTQDDLVRHENGWQVPPDDLPALVDVLRLALSDPVKLRQMGEASYRIVANEINLDKMVDVFIRAANEVYAQKY